MPIKAITFDFWSTLYVSRTEKHSQRLLELKQAVEQHSGRTVELEQFKAAVRTARHTWTQTWMREYRTIPADEWLGVMLDQLHISLHPDGLFKIRTKLENSVLGDTPTLIPDVKKVLADLSARYRLAIISDTGLTPGRVLRQILANDDLLGYFTHLTFSDEVGRSKPHSQAFLTTLEALGAEPAAAVHVGDLLRTDIAGAQGVGMRAVQYVGVNQDGWIKASDVPATTVVPDAVIRKHVELPPLLQQWNGRGPVRPPSPLDPKP